MTSASESSLGFLSHDPDPARYEYLDLGESESPVLILDCLRGASKVLDVGCGTGALAEWLKKETGAQIVGIEPNSDRVRMARKRGIEVLAEYLDERTASTLGHFDAILFSDVLEHMENPSMVLGLSREFLLRPGGFVVASVPNVAHWSVRIDLLRGRFEYEAYGIMDSTHLRWFTERSLRALFGNSGFTVDEFHHTAGCRLDAYRNRRPWRWLPAKARNHLVRILARRIPKLFACQFVVKAFC